MSGPAVVTCPVCGRKNRVPQVADGVPRCGNCGALLPWIAEARDSDFVDVTDATVPVLVDLWAPWCGPCRMVSPALEHLAAAFAGRLKLVKVNVDEAPGVAQRFSVQGIPTLVLLEHGELLASRTGAAPEPVLRDWLAQLIDRDQSASVR
jgi:thioredoxin 2